MFMIALLKHVILFLETTTMWLILLLLMKRDWIPYWQGLHVPVERTCETTSFITITSDYRKLFSFRLVPVFASITRSSWRYNVVSQRDSDTERMLMTNRKWFRWSRSWRCSFALVDLVIGSSKGIVVLFNFLCNCDKIVKEQFVLLLLIIVNLLEENEVVYEFEGLLMLR